eukprot:748428-Hanusia_phi.AAC.5
MQKHPVSCGLASIAIALNALKVPTAWISMEDDLLQVATWRNVLGQRRVISNASSLSADDFNDDFEAVTEEEVASSRDFQELTCR